MNENILIVAPHCDDEILGCGGIMAKYISKGYPVYVAIITNGHLGAPEIFPREGTEQVREEALEAHNILGVKDTFFLDFPAPKLDSIPAYKLSMELNKLITKLGITTLYIPHRGDIHKDHRITYEASLVAARPIDDCPVRAIYAYETLSETEWAPPFGDDAFIPTVFEDIGAFLDKKLEAFECYSTQIKTFPHSRSLHAIEAISNYRGSTVGVENAEAFMLVREIK
ncbi:PIG-L deacetylase family protein [Halalkalibaculum sp. DA3122]|uniref:PIG-L deacetylase family protein n=1 Tax=unclassified Halalkalibaculum TaxID=2964617 RepID=UPI003754D7B5